MATTLGLSLAGLLAVSLPIRGAIPSANAAALAPGVASSNAPFHLRLEKSEPSKGAVLDASPTVIRLFFSLPPEMAVTAIKLSDAADNAITLSAPPTMLKLLKGETRLMDSLPISQHLLTYQNIPLMFLKKIEGRVNVNYPRSWFIRMNIE